MSKTLIEVTPGLVICPSDIVAVEERTHDELDRTHHHAALYLSGGHIIRIGLKQSFRFQDVMSTLFNLAPNPEADNEDTTEEDTPNP